MVYRVYIGLKKFPCSHRNYPTVCGERERYPIVKHVNPFGPIWGSVLWGLARQISFKPQSLPRKDIP